MIDHVLRFTVPAAYALLPPVMQSDKATAMLLAIGLHEGDGFRARKQYGIGRAHGFWQFERIAVREVLENSRTEKYAAAVVDALCYRLPNASSARQALELYEAVTHNDTLACAFARLNLWKYQKPLAPGPDDVEMAFHQYVDIWKPGAYTRGTEEMRLKLRAVFGHRYTEAWQRVNAARVA